MEQVTLDLIPVGAKTVCHASQYDIGRTIRFNLVNNNQPVTLAGTETIVVKITKPDGTEIEKNLSNTSSTYADWVTGEGDCDQAGIYNCEIKLTDGSAELGSKNFTIKVEEDPYNGEGVVVETASGPIATFETNLADVLQSLKCEITASGGNGSPDSPIPIVGHSELNLTRCGKNLWDEQTERGNIDTTTGEKTPNNYVLRSINYIKVSPNTVLYATVSWIQCYFYDANKNYISYQAFSTNTINVPNNAEYMLFRLSSDYGTTYNNDISINYPATDTEYHAYNGTPYLVQFGQVVYGGVYDKSGRLTITHGYVTLNGTEGIYWQTLPTGDASLTAFYISVSSWESIFGSSPKRVASGELLNGKSDKLEIKPQVYYTLIDSDGIYGWTDNSVALLIVPPSGVVDFNTWLVSNNLSIVYELATPIVIDVPSISVLAENGVNNVFSDTGDTEVKYLYNA